MKVLEDTKRTGLPNFLPRSAFLVLLQKKTEVISFAPFDFVEKMWNYVERVVISVLLRHCENCPQLSPSTRRAVENVVADVKKRFVDWVTDLVEMEKITDYTCDPAYVDLWNKYMSHKIR
ncbi:hypothetical protein ACS0TY_004267 [Phlomoides rotata]